MNVCNCSPDIAEEADIMSFIVICITIRYDNEKEYFQSVTYFLISYWSLCSYLSKH